MSTIDSANDVYFALVRAFPLLPIESAEELDRAIAVINSLLDKPALSVGEQGYLDVLSDLVEKYESTEHRMDPVSDGDMLRHLIEAKGRYRDRGLTRHRDCGGHLGGLERQASTHGRPGR